MAVFYHALDWSCCKYEVGPRAWWPMGWPSGFMMAESMALIWYPWTPTAGEGCGAAEEETEHGADKCCATAWLVRFWCMPFCCGGMDDDVFDVPCCWWPDNPADALLRLVSTGGVSEADEPFDEPLDDEEHGLPSLTKTGTATRLGDV